MAWIRQVEPSDDGDPVLHELWQAAIARAGSVANVIRVMSLEPRVCEASMGFYLATMKSETCLSRATRELLAAVVSHVNDCYY
jgi:alkylhydroperoxidase family enzyme